MTAAFTGWFNDSAEWADESWRKFTTFAQAAWQDVQQILEVALGLLLLIALAPVLAHLAALLLIWLLGAPLWVVAVLLFSH